MTIVSNPIIYTSLSSKYGRNNIYWPLIWSDNIQVKMYTYEINDICKTNSFSTNFPSSSSRIPTYLVDYTKSHRTITPPNTNLITSIDPRYKCSYDYTVKSNSPYVTVDIDYMWNSNKGRRSLELTTFYVPFDTKETALKVINQINKRPSWRNGATAILTQIQASKDLGSEKYIMGCVNSIGRSNYINVDGNALWFDLDNDQISRLLKGQDPTNYTFGSFTKFLDSL